MTIPEIYPGIEEEAVRVGADVYEMYGVVDAIAHEYEFGAGDHMASSRSQFDWFLYQVGYAFFPRLCQGKATWLLNYSWDGDKGVDPREAMKNLAMSQVMAGVNTWDAPGHTMAGSNDIKTRAEILAGLRSTKKPLFPARAATSRGSIFFPEKQKLRRNWLFALVPRYVVIAVATTCRVSIVTPRTLEKFSGTTLVLPNVTVLDDTEKAQLRKFSTGGGHLS